MTDSDVMHELESRAASVGITVPLLTHPRGSRSIDPDFTIADGVLAFRARIRQQRSVRDLSVGTMRGVGHIRGWHQYLIDGEGVRVHPWLESLVARGRT